MAFVKLLLCALIGVTVAQDLSGTNYNAGDSGRSETVNPDGSVQGQYSYTDPNGKLITVKYRAGKDGFQVEGDHLPRSPTPQGAAPPQRQQQPSYNQYAGPQQQQYNHQPQQQYNHQPQQQYNHQQQPQQPQQYSNNAVNNNDDDGSYNPQHHLQYQYQPSLHQEQSPQQPQQQQQYNQYQPQPQQYNNPQSQQPQQNNIPASTFNNFGGFGQQNSHPNSIPQFNNQQGFGQFGQGGQGGSGGKGRVSLSQQPGQGFTYTYES